MTNYLTIASNILIILVQQFQKMIGRIIANLSLLIFLSAGIVTLQSFSIQTAQNSGTLIAQKALNKVQKYINEFSQVSPVHNVHQWQLREIDHFSLVNQYDKQNINSRFENIHLDGYKQKNAIRLLQLETQETQAGCDAGCIIGYIVIWLIIFCSASPFIILIIFGIIIFFKWIIDQCMKIKSNFPKWKPIEEYNCVAPTFDKVCCICLDNICCDLKLQCDHNYHLSCLAKWLQKDKSCPYCRKKQDVQVYHFCTKCRCYTLKFEGLYHLNLLYETNKQKFNQCQKCKEDMMNPEERIAQSQKHLKIPQINQQM